MTAIEFIVEHLGAILAAYQETESNKTAWERLKGIIPEIEQAMSFETFRKYSSILLVLNAKLNIPYLLESLDELNMVKQLNTELNKQIELNTELNSNAELNTVKQELDAVKHELNKLNSQGLNIQVKQEAVKHGLNIGGWSVQESGGYFRAFKKVGGKMYAVYLGKNLDDAETKIRTKEAAIRGQGACNPIA